ncbi:MAG: iron-sulfur cluster repair di-iron protein [Cyclobacteriaceae bacterium]|nr:iron-sulfur cluster repair di-iron protein [Cyclobacteriaceae bacterium]
MNQAPALNISSVKVCDIALHIPEAIEILNRHNLDYCCNGQQSFLTACANALVNPDKVWLEIIEAQTMPVNNHRMKFATWPTTFLIDFICEHHHNYVRTTIPRLRELLAKVHAVHNLENPELTEVRAIFDALADELLAHLPKEEMVLFPAIRSMIEHDALSENNPAAFGLQAPLHVMEHEHESAGDLIKSLRELTNNYTPPAGACPTYQAAYQLLKQFDEDLIQHIHLENNILFPKVKMNLQ